MTVRVKCFALARDLTQFGERSFDLAEDANAGDALAAVIADAPELAKFVSGIRLAVNLEYVDLKHALRDGDEVAIIPPVSGGQIVPRGTIS